MIALDVKDSLHQPPAVDVALGPLEQRVLEALWDHGPATVRDLIQHFPGVAYTTLMTTADRLYRKHVLVRVRHGRAFRYEPRWSRSAFEVRLAGSTLSALLADDPQRLAPILSLFVDEVSRRDATMLDELERLVRQKKEREP